MHTPQVRSDGRNLTPLHARKKGGEVLYPGFCKLLTDLVHHGCEGRRRLQKTVFPTDRFPIPTE
ncbi:hypothetical protein E2C01_004735 [Portunus trituberculatus]|uniref:Uncharacterized protein n=1 Tax=Portunus trituberculatus TaxID=210409 RepID=A0A5B7CQF7_PORTR|nr:hypothetical protein [Portunus trituberculatus]